MSSQCFDYFFDLPIEIRAQILSYLCLFPTGIWVGGGVGGRNLRLTSLAAYMVMGISPPATKTITIDNDISTKEESNDCGTDNEKMGEDADMETCNADPPINLFLASPLLYREAGDLYYGCNAFHFAFTLCTWGRVKKKGHYHHRLDGQQQFHGHDQLLQLLQEWNGPITAEADTLGARRRVRRAVAHVGRLGGFVTHVVVPALADLALNGALRHLRVHIGGGLEFLPAGHSPEVLEFVQWERQTAHERRRLRRWERHAAEDDQAAHAERNPALRALLVLLADPGLESAELRVPRSQHGRFWCDFHRGGWSDKTGGRCGAPEGFASPSGQHDGMFIGVDISRLVEACAGDAAEFNIKKVG
ncbi:hypothetical protein C7999DRAFT_42609 [Corynascus novoguineensis]|uniref:Uncharacterized protein n=1 Tax=Corynascus novoguineensis TaxID=1126955 RepID=A0AAN7HLN5_9PEZI|nr:hypothetical protein C7999DRAFT_42609 [Corynascus novoguineensis]